MGDAGFKARCEERYRALSSAGYTIVLVSHDPLVISTFCKRAVLLDGGQIVMNDTAPKVADAYVRLVSRPTAVRSVNQAARKS